LFVAAVAAVALVGCGGDDPAGTATTEPPVSVPASSDGMGQFPDRDADVTGVVGTDDAYPAQPHLVEPSDDYYLGMSLLRGEPFVVDADGTVLSASELDDGDEVAVWTGDACAESFPVQCDIVAIEVIRPR
jgi:hypothetical protein